MLQSDPLDKMLSLTVFLAGAAGRRWAWGSCDCTMLAADWVQELHGIDPATELRGSYRSAAEARWLARLHGGFEAQARELLDPLFAHTSTYEPGDIALVNAPARLKAVMPVVGGVFAIRGVKLWVSMGVRGLVGREFDVLTAWRT